MWPLVQSDDGCLMHPIRAVTAADGLHALRKEVSEIEKGDVVFCLPQPNNNYYAHLVLDITPDFGNGRRKFWIGNIMGRRNGWCYREYIFGILVKVSRWHGTQYHPRPHPKLFFEQVRDLVQWDRWSNQANELCQPRWGELCTGAVSSQQKHEL